MDSDWREEPPQSNAAVAARSLSAPTNRDFRRAGLSASNGEARRLIRGGGARVNDIVIASESQPIGVGDLNEEGVVKLSAGRKRHALIRPV